MYRYIDIWWYEIGKEYSSGVDLEEIIGRAKGEYNQNILYTYVKLTKNEEYVQIYIFKYYKSSAVLV